MKKIVHKTVLSLAALGVMGHTAFALDSGTQDLTTTVGATDYFKISCAKSDNSAVGDTDHLNFKLFENSAAIPTTTTALEPILPQVLNATLTKLKLNTKVSAISAGTNKEVILKGGNGAYTLSLDTFGTNLTLKTAQTYSVQYQCLNAAGKVTTGSSTLVGQSIESKSKTLANNKTAKYVINCAKQKTAGDTSSLKVKITNKTPVEKSVETPLTSSSSSGNLTAQVIKGATALNTSGDTLDVQVGNGDYSIMVNSPTNTAQTYHFQYSCLNKNNVETKTSPFQTLQNQ